MYGALDIAVSGMIAQRTRMDVITANTVNQNVVRDAQGNLNPYRRRDAVFTTGSPGSSNPFARALGVHVSTIVVDQTPPALREYQPDHPDAYRDGPFRGYVATSNVNPVMEQVNSLEAARAYEANAAAAEATKQMMVAALRLLA